MHHWITPTHPKVKERTIKNLQADIDEAPSVFAGGVGDDMGDGVGLGMGDD